MRLYHGNMNFFEEDTEEDLIDGIVGLLAVASVALLVSLKAVCKTRKALKA